MIQGRNLYFSFNIHNIGMPKIGIVIKFTRFSLDNSKVIITLRNEIKSRKTLKILVY